MKRDEYPTIGTPSLKSLLADNELQIIDTRPVDAYNGWRMMGEVRGGHIPGARSLPSKWLNYIDWIEIVKSKDIAEKDKIVVYGYDEEDIYGLANRLMKSGYKDVTIYPEFLSHWIPDTDLPLDYLPRFRHLVPPSWLRSLVQGEKPEHYNGDGFVICHVHYRNPVDYEKGHIPGAIPLDTLELESPETWNRRSPQEIRGTLERLGITENTTVVLYGRFSHPKNDDPFPGSSAGHLGAIRCAFIMLYAGVRDVKVLNGGIQSWKDAGYNLSTEITEARPVDDYDGEIPSRPELAVDIEEAKEMIKSEDADLVSVRSWPEYIGEVSGYNYIEKKGRIPGVIWGNCGSDAYHMENYRNLDHSMKEFREIEQGWKKDGILPEKHLAFYCGTGWRGSEAFFNAWLMGWPKVSVFDGGWFEWSNDPDNPYETGIPANMK